jgi:hypothetical protein
MTGLTARRETTVGWGFVADGVVLVPLARDTVRSPLVAL